MRLTPLDIRKQEFKKAMRGLDNEEVYAFLTTVADEYEAVLNDNKSLRERLLELDDKVQEYRTMEKTLRDTLLTAERVTVDAKENARREADLVIKEAQIEAEKAVRNIKSDAMKLRQDIQSLKQQRDSYTARIRMLVESHLKFVETAEEDFAEEENRLEIEQAKWVAGTPDDSYVAPSPPVDVSNMPGSAAVDQPSAAPAPSPQPAPVSPPPAPTPGNPEQTQSAHRPSGRAEARDAKPGASLNDILNRVIERQKDNAPAATPGPDAAHGTAADTATPRTPTSTEAAPQPTATQEVTSDRWSLDDLRKDILTRQSDVDETP